MAFADVFGRDPLEVLLLGGLALVIVAAVARTVLQRRVLQGRAEDAEPLLVFPEDTIRRPMTPASIRQPAWGAEQAHGGLEDGPDATGGTAVREEDAAAGDAAAARPEIQPFASRPTPAPIRPAPQPWARREPGVRSIESARWMPPAQQPDPSEVDEASQTIRIPTADDGTVQLLPGRLVMTQGPDVGKEYRFLRVAGQPTPQVTLGRISGPPYKHIQLPAATVSRMHARMRFDNGAWHISNLSTTNPVRLNGKELSIDKETPLSDGDRVQLGEVELSFVDGLS